MYGNNGLNDRVLAWFARHPEALTAAELAPHLGAEPKAVKDACKYLLKLGKLAACKVERPGTPPQNQYRASAGGAAPVEFRELKPPRPLIVARPAPAPFVPAAPDPSSYRAGAAAADPAAQPVVADSNAGSAPGELDRDTSSAPGRTPPPAPSVETDGDRPAAGLHASSPAERLAGLGHPADPGRISWALWDDGYLTVLGADGNELVEIAPADTLRLRRFLMQMPLPALEVAA
jgi:hypothetical protein